MAGKRTGSATTVATRDEAPGKAAATRRIPTQARSLARVDKILAAAGDIFAAQGIEAATMDAIAARAETSIGSIYQFFPNKQAIFDALVRRYHDRLRVYLDGLIGADPPWPQLLDAAIDGLAALQETDPGFRAVWIGMHVTEAVVSDSEALNRELAQRLAAVFASQLPALPARRRLFVARMTVDIVSTLMVVSARRGYGGPGAKSEAHDVLVETKKLVRLYLAPYEAKPR